MGFPQTLPGVWLVVPVLLATPLVMGTVLGQEQPAVGVRAWLDAADDAGREKALASLAGVPVPSKLGARAALLTEALGRTKLSPHARTIEKLDVAGEKLDCWFATPRDYDPAKKYPVVFSLCGWGMNGRDGLVTFSLPDDEWAAILKDVEEEQKKKGQVPDTTKFKRPSPVVGLEDAIVVAPSWLPSDPKVESHEPPVERTLAICQAALRKAARELSVDPNRVIAAGFSRGGAASHRMAALRPDLFAGVVVMASGGDLEYPPVSNLRPLELLILHGEKDERLNIVEWGQRTHDRLDREKVKHQFIRIPNLGHRWPPFAKNGPIVEWIKARERKPWPPAFEHKFVSLEQPRRAFWVELPAGGESNVSVTTDTKANTIDLTIEKAPKSLVLHLGEPLVDLDKEVVVRSGEKVLFKGKVERSWGELLADFVRERYDVARAAPARLELKLED